jgi:hypothetical protein
MGKLPLSTFLHISGDKRCGLMKQTDLVEEEGGLSVPAFLYWLIVNSKETPL